MVKGPGVITGRYGTIGQVYFVEDDFWPLNTTLYVRDFKGNDPKFISYFLKTVDFFAYSDKAAVPGVNRNHLHEAFAVLPNLTTQKLIAGFLGALDDRITLLRETNATLEAIAQALFKSWFVDFDPVRAKLEGRAPEGMDEATAALFPDALNPWPTKKVAQLIIDGALVIGDGYRAKNSELGFPGFAFVRAGDLTGGQILPTRDHLKADSASKAPGKASTAGDTVFTSKGTIGRFAFVDADSGGAIYSPQVCFWRSIEGRVLTPEFLHYWMKSPSFTRQVKAVQGQSAIMDFVSLTSQREMLVDIPPIALQKRFSEIALTLLEGIAENRHAADTLSSLRDTLLPRLISGQLRLPEASPVS